MKEYKTLAIHSQSDRPGTPSRFEGDPAEKAFESRALMLPNVELVGLSQLIEPAYAAYAKTTLKFSLPEPIVPEITANSLSQSFLQSNKAVELVKQRQKKVKKPFALSVFDVTDSERELLIHLQKKEIQIFPEVNFDQAILLGDKATFREFCDKYAIPQIKGGVFKAISQLQKFLAEHPNAVIKHPVGTAGEGMSFVTQEKPPTEKDFLIWQQWIESRQGKGIIAEIFNQGGDEHAVHIYRNPFTKKSRVSGIYDQLVKENDKGVLSHYGCRYPVANLSTRQSLKEIGHNLLIPALEEVDYTGPACFDVLSGPTHFMELNARAGDNMYKHLAAKKVGKAVYDTSDISFMSLSSLPHEIKSFAEFYDKFTDVLQPTERGMVVLTNPNRHEFGYYDVMAVTPYPNRPDIAQDLLFKGLTQIWGKTHAEELFNKIYKRS